MSETENKVYYHQTPGAKFYMPDGREVAFAGGRLELSTIPAHARAAVRAELDKVADVPTSHIFTKNRVMEPGEQQSADELRKMAEAQFDGDRRITGNPTTIPLPVSKSEPPVLPSALVAAKEAIAKAGTQAGPTAKQG